MLELSDIHTFYGESHVLHGVSLKADKGSVVALLGRNGMGKTTLVRSIVGFTPPRQGVVRFKGQEIHRLPSHRIARLGIGLVPQGHRMFPSLSVEENLTLGMRGDGWTLDRIYDLFPILKTRARHGGNKISGGEQQLACIGRALLTNPDLLILDEPSEGLAPLIIQSVADALVRLKSEGLSILIVEQNIPLALRLCDEAYILSGGKIVYHGTSADLTGNLDAQSEHLGVAG